MVRSSWNGSWVDSSTITTTTGGTLNLGNSSSLWSDTGTINTTNTTVNLGGSFTAAGLGTFNRTGGVVNLTGKLDASASGLALNAATGSWNIAGGTPKGGTFTAVAVCRIAIYQFRRNAGQGDGQCQFRPGHEQRRPE